MIDCYNKMCLAGLSLEKRDLALVNEACDQIPDSQIAAAFCNLFNDKRIFRDGRSF